MGTPEARNAKDIFQDALEQPAEERNAFLDEACGGDEELRREVSSLLSALDDAGDFLAEPTAGGASPPPDSAGLPPDVPERIGPYRILRTIGEGGMGIVLLAEQERPVRRQVAIKLIRHSMASREAQIRFDAERRALSRMEHSHIATIHDAGTTEDGRPYFVMERVEGTPIGRFCDDAGLSVAERIELFIDVCQGVHHAHQKGIIHRDLKPSNILVRTEEGRPVPKIIDFGIAKVVSETPGTESGLTRFGMLVGTPEFMSPEQAAGDDVDTRSDVYSLGVVLYQLLSGALPLERDRLRSGSPAEARRLLAEVDPERPSTRVGDTEETASIARRRGTDTRTLARTLRGDLDSIVMKALEKDPAWRYDSAAALAADLRRYLDHETVLARPATVGYRARKFLGRHRGAVVASALAVVLLVAGLITTSYFWLNSQRNANLANERYDEIRRLSDLKRLSDYLAEAENLWPAHPDRIDAMVSWLDKAERLAARLPLHERTLAELSARMGEGSGATDVEAHWQLDNLRQLVEKLRDFTADDPRRSAIADVRGRLKFAREVEARSIDAHREDWDKTLRAIADPRQCPAYGGLRLEPQLGLVPLGPDSASGLMEFAHLQSGTIPTRGDDGALDVTEESAIVLVLIPGGSFRMGSAPASLGVDLDFSSGEARVRNLDAESLGEELGLRKGDRLVALDGAACDDAESYATAEARMLQGEHAVVSIMREGQSLELDLDLVGRNLDPAHDPLEAPVNTVTLAPYFLSKFEMTQGQWLRFMGSNPSQYGPAERPPRTLRDPVEHVTWFQCRDVLYRLGLMLPTEAQWEYAARAGTSSPWWTGWDRGSLDGAANIADAFLAANGGHPSWSYERWLNDGWTTHAPVGSYAANPWGLHDITGNVSEWCRDRDSDYTSAVEPGTGARLTPASEFRIIRGGSWFQRATSSRSANRDKSTPERLDATLGVRPARAVDTTHR